jgi:peptide/nickel transport system substrate-binding protein
VKSRFRLLLVLAGLAAATLWAVTAATARTTASNIIIDGTTDTVTNIDPSGNYDFGTKAIDFMVFERLLDSGPGNNLTPHPMLATKCSSVGGLQTWTCTLRKGVKFSNGDPFTSADVKFSFDRSIKINDPSGISSLFSNLASTTTNGDYSVTFHLKNPEATWPNILTTPAAQIVDHNVYPADKLQPSTSQQVGTGPYVLSTYTPGQQAVLKPNSSYWGTKPKNGGVIINYYTTSSTLKLALEKGEIDMAFETFTPTQIVSLQKEKGITVHQGRAASIRYLVMDPHRAPTNKLAVRQAIAYLMPRQTIASRVYHGQVKPLYSMVAAGLPGHIDAFKTLYGASPNSAKAKAVLQKAHIKTPVKATLWYTPSHYGDASADEYAEIQRALNASGLFKITLKTAEWTQYVRTLGTTKGLFQLGWFPDFVDAEDYLNPFYPKGEFLQNGYSSKQMNALAVKEAGAKTTSARLAFVKQEQLLAAKDVPIVPYWQGNMIVAAKTNVQGIDSTLDPTFTMRFNLLSKS